MTLAEFDMHRPTLAASLRMMLDHEDWEIVPNYSDGIMFVARRPGLALACVNRTHSLSMIDLDADGVQGTWVWEFDLGTSSSV